jgi:hypothetical protein
VRQEIPVQTSSRSGFAEAGFAACVVLGLFMLNFDFSFPSANQHTYMIHAFRLLGMPGLARDWMAHTVDPAPLVTLLSAGAYRVAGPPGIAALYFLCCAAFIGCWHAIARRERLEPLAQFLSLPLLLMPLLNPVNTWAAYGLAEQYLLGGYLQPSEAGGALLMLGFAFYVWERPYWTVTMAALAATLHPGSLMTASLIAGMVSLAAASRRDWRQAGAAAALFAAAIVPVVAFALLAFRAGPPEVAAEGARILVHVRIPHHALPAEWLGPRTYLCIGLVLLTMLVWRHDRRIAFGLGSLLVTGILLSIAVVLINRDPVSLLFPWRVSAMLVPLSWLLLSIAAGRGLARWLGRWRWSRNFDAWMAAPVGRVVAIAIVLAGAAVAPLSPFPRSFFPKGYAAGLIAWVQATTTPEDVFVIPLDAEWFRLNAGRPVLIDWKSNPYRDDEVIAWLARTEQSTRITQAFCQSGRMPAEAASIAAFLLIDRHLGCTVDLTRAAYFDADFAVFRVRPAE